jgi:cytochrome c
MGRFSNTKFLSIPLTSINQLKELVLKKYYVAIAFLAFTAASCGSGADNKDAKTTTPASGASELSSNPDYTKGVELIAKSDCLTCHKINEKLTGPAYKDVALKYESNDENINLLASKIIKGGQGVWGPIPMTPHASLSEGDAKQMVKYILLLRNK